MSAVSAVLGIIFAANGHVNWAVCCLLISGICDGFDGKVAKKKKNRSEQQKMFGIQIDSLCDLIAFGVLPAVIMHCSGLKGVVNDIIKVAYVLAAVIRLAYYNVMEEESLRTTSQSRNYFQGLPVTSISIIMPIIFTIQKILLKQTFGTGLNITMAAVAILFITDVKIKKPTMKMVLVSVIFSVCIMGYIIYHYVS